jgi:hypothetical protein
MRLSIDRERSPIPGGGEVRPHWGLQYVRV